MPPRFVRLPRSRRRAILAAKGGDFVYTYIFDGTDMNIRTPNLTDFSLVKKELISQTASKIVMRLTYPDGLEFTVEQEAKRTTVYSNRPLIQNPDGSYTAP